MRPPPVDPDDNVDSALLQQQLSPVSTVILGKPSIFAATPRRRKRVRESSLQLSPVKEGDETADEPPLATVRESSFRKPRSKRIRLTPVATLERGSLAMLKQMHAVRRLQWQSVSAAADSASQDSMVAFAGNAEAAAAAVAINPPERPISPDFGADPESPCGEEEEGVDWDAELTLELSDDDE